MISSSDQTLGGWIFTGPKTAGSYGQASQLVEVEAPVPAGHREFIEVVSSFSGAFGRSENPMAGTAVLPCATHDCWLCNCSRTKLTNAHMIHNTFKPSILLRTTLNTWRLTPHVSRWDIEKVLEIALCLIPLYPKPQIPAVEIESSSRFQSSQPRHRPGDGPVLFMGFSRGRGKECRITSRGNSSGVHASRGSAGDGKMDVKGGPGVGKLWKLGRLSKPFKTNIEYSGTPGIWKLW